MPFGALKLLALGSDDLQVIDDQAQN